MRFAIGGRGCGKTTTIIDMMLKDKHSVMVCHSHEAVRQMIDQHGKLIEPHRFVPFEQFAVYMAGRRAANVYIDNVDLVLTRFCAPHNVVGATATGDAEFLGNDHKVLISTEPLKLPTSKTGDEQ